MRNWTTLLVLIALALSASSQVPVDHAFDLGASARGLGLGGAFAALVDDETAVVHNPAALVKVADLGFSSFYVRQFGGVTYGSVSLAVPWIGINASLIESGPITSPQGAFRYASQAFSASLALPLGPLAVGVRWRSLHVSAPTRGRGWSFDPALRMELGSLRLGAIMESALSAPLTYTSGRSEHFEPSLRIGVAATLSPAPDILWNAAFEAAGLMRRDPSFRAGIEAWIGGVGARVGYDGEGPTVGLTLRLAGLQLDWAYATRTDLGESHRVSLTFRRQTGDS